MSKEKGFGIVGAGLISSFHLKAIRDCQGGYAVGIFDVRPESAAKMAQEYNITPYDSLDEMLDDPAIDIVCVGTPNHLHGDIVKAAAAKGKHILTEKPPAMNLWENDQMQEACDKAGVKYGCFVQSRTRKSIQAIKQAVDSGRFGKILHADAYMKWFRPQDYYQSAGWRGQKRCGSGVTVAQGFHYIDLLQYLAGPVVGVEAKMANIAHPGIALEDDVVAHLEFACGARGLVQLSTALWPGTDIRIEINGTDGTAVMCGETLTTWKFKDNRPEDKDILGLGSSSQATGAGGAADFGHNDHAVVVQDMIDAIATNREVIIPTHSVRPTLEIVLGMYQSAARKAPVSWPIVDDETIWDS